VPIRVATATSSSPTPSVARARGVSTSVRPVEERAEVRKTARPAAVTPAQNSTPRSGSRRSRAARNSSENISPVTTSGWTSTSGPNRSATACSPNPMRLATIPSSHRGFCTRCQMSRKEPVISSGAADAV
jgi:hypothetical protein